MRRYLPLVSISSCHRVTLPPCPLAILVCRHASCHLVPLSSWLAGPGRVAGNVAGLLGSPADLFGSAFPAESGEGLAAAGFDAGASPGLAGGVADTGWGRGLASTLPMGGLLTGGSGSPCCPGSPQRPSAPHGNNPAVGPFLYAGTNPRSTGNGTRC